MKKKSRYVDFFYTENFYYFLFDREKKMPKMYNGCAVVIG